MSRWLSVSAVPPGTHAWLAEWRDTVGTLVVAGDTRDTAGMVDARCIRSEFLGGRDSTPALYEALTGRPIADYGRNMMEVTDGDDPVRGALIGGDLHLGVVDENGAWEGDIRASTADEAAGALRTLERLAGEPSAAEWSELVRRQVGAYDAFYRTLQPGEEVVYRW